VPLVVVIAGPQHLATVCDRLSGVEVLPFADKDVLDALATISTKRPSRVVLERQFASSSRGAALVNRIKADPALASVVVEVMNAEVRERQPEPGPAPAAAVAGTRAHVDWRGTRRAPRRRMRDGVDIIVDGHAARLIDLSTEGAQVTSTLVLKPNQRVRVSLVDESGSQRLAGLIVWASYELPRAGRPGPIYRAGLSFSHGDAAAIDAFAQRHEQR
jgi:hypothetical protein